MIKKELKHCIIEINGISERITVLALMINGTPINIIEVYPTEASREEDIIEFYNLLDDTLNNYKAHRTFVMGDFNSKIGHRDYGEEEVMGPHGFGIRNERGDKLIQFAQGQRLKIMNTFFRKTPSSRWTWRAPNGRTKNEIDFILADKREGIRDVQVINGLRFDTDHRMIRLHLQIKKRKRPFIISQSTKPDRINQQQYKEMLQHTLTDPNQQSETNTQILYTKLSKCILQAAKSSTFPNKKSERQDKLKETTKRLIEKREELKANANNSDEKKQEFEEINRRTKREIRRDIREHNTELIRRTIEHSKSTKKVARAISKGKQWMLGVKDATGKKLTSREDILIHATDFYKVLYSSTPNNIIQAQNYRSPADDETEGIPPIHSPIYTRNSRRKYRLK